MVTPGKRTGFLFTVSLTIFLLAGCAGQDTESEEAGDPYDASMDVLRYEQESHLRNVRQVTFGGNNAEAYWSFDDEHLVFQSDWSDINGQGCDQIYIMDPETAVSGEASEYQLASTGQGRTTCSFFMPGNEKIVYGSTHEGARECPETVMFGQGRYVWPIYETYDIYVSNLDGSELETLIGGPGYDAEATVSPDGKYIVFTSTRSGDLELWRYEIETEEIIQLTSGLGYDGGAFFSPDSKQIVWRASRPTGEEGEVYQSLLSEGLVEPSELNIFVANIDGSDARQVTDLPGANWAPFFHPDGDRIVFTTNHHTMDQGGRQFAVFMIGTDGTGLTQITYGERFDGFPMFSYDGTRLVFSSNRNVSGEDSADTNVFVADWVETP